ncbi:Lsr2 family protein [Nocardioides sp. KR10-350]|uniref:histone-like nucleoid-structuring protein Lsr2 n=1 Tax=Nocardioides cheoyonin TaxID=3156615 RepID=UPI0032B58868
MAQKVQILLEDDIDGGEATQTVTFGFDGTTYEIDLNDKNAAKLQKALTPFIEAGRKVSKTGGRAKKATTGGASAAEIRAWAKSNGYEVPDRGRIPAEVRSAFDSAS